MKPTLKLLEISFLLLKAVLLYIYYEKRNIVKALILIIILGLFSRPLLAEEKVEEKVEEKAVKNPFANFETIVLPNGLKIWYKHLPTDSNVSLSVTVPWGSDQDPIGKEQLAHFTEHMLFSDHLGRTEEQIKKEVEDLGGVRNAYTYTDHTFYFVRIDKQYGLFALEWLYKVISPHTMDEKIVERQREPVAIEVRARKRELFDWIDAYYLNPYWLRPADFWTREFGENVFPTRDWYPYESLHKITSKDLKDFYNTYYTPKGMTLTIIGNLSKDEILEKINSTFARLESHPPYESKIKLKNPNRFWQLYSWSFSANIFYFNGFKFYDLTKEEQFMVIFISQLLQNRLNEQLRYGERKATYGMVTPIAQRGNAAILQILGNLKESEYTFARGVIEKEIESLRNKTLKEEVFQTEKAAIINKLCVMNSSSKDLEQWVSGSFYNPERHTDFPDLVAIFKNYTKDELEEFALKHLVREKQILEVYYVNPLSQGIFAALGVLLLVITLSVTRRYLLSALPIARLRYIARFRMSLLTRLLVIILFLVVLAIGGQFLYFIYQWLVFNFILSIESFWIQWAIFALMGVVSLVLFMLLIARLPSKLLLFNDGLAIKYFSYRSKLVPLNEIKEISLQPFSSVWLSSRIWKCVPLTFAFFSPGIYMRLSNGWAYFFELRNKQEFLDLLKELKQSKDSKD
ncbi:MAG: insulinase family protein [Acidobacteria bacterium]|nr:insulinase family protein [Acidobacteriota bacterium]